MAWSRKDSSIFLWSLQKIDEEDRKYNQIFSQILWSSWERSFACEHKEEFFQKYGSCESKVDSGDQEISSKHAPFSQ